MQIPNWRPGQHKISVVPVGATPSGHIPIGNRAAYWNNGAYSGKVTPLVMQTRLCHARRPDVLAIVLLAALLFRAYIPVGFMPASGTPFLVELCPAVGGA